MRPRPLVVPFVLVLTCLALGASPAGAIKTKYVEDFTTTDYRDAANTTALWDTNAGELRLPPFEITLAGSYDTPGSASHVAIDGDYAYVADGDYGLRVINITNPASPTLAGSYDTPGNALDVAVDGDYAYVADGDYGLRVINITNPASPTLAGSYNTPGWAYGVAISGDHAYVADGLSGLQVISITNPASPTLAGSYDTPGFAYRVAISGDCAYVADGLSSLQVISITNPASPTLLGSYATPDYAIDVAISGDYAYVGGGDYGLQVIDITNPASPILAGSYNTPGWAWGVAISGDYAYVGDYYLGLQVIDITNPASPTLEGSYNTPGYAMGVVISGDYAYVADYDSGLQVIHITNPASPMLAGSYATPGYAPGVAISGDYAYVADYNSGVQVINITNPASPTLAGSCDTPGFASGVAISGDYAYVADYNSGVQVINITMPASPTLAGSYATPGYASGVAISGDYAYVADYNSGLQVINITMPASPTLAGSCDTPDYANGVAISGDYAYVADGESGLQVIDITNPASPTLAGSYDTPGYASGVAISGDYAYVADGFFWGLQVINITNPASPTFAGSYCTAEHSACGVAISGDYAYVVDDYGLQVLDITTPANPTLADSCDTPGAARGIAISGDYAYVADGANGLQVIEVFQRRYYTGANIGWSLAIDDSDDTIVRARLSSTQTGSVTWELSAVGAQAWEGFVPGAAWSTFRYPGTDLLWRSTHNYAGNYAGGGVNPTCSHLEIEWLYRFAMIDSVADIPGDQGGRVRLYLTRSGLDFADASQPIATYNVWRRVDDPSLLQSLHTADEVSGSSSEIPVESCGSMPIRVWADRYFLVNDGGSLSSAFPPGTWEVVGSFAASQLDRYIYATTTLGDSTGAGAEYTVYCVSAHTTTPSIWYLSPPDSGYSIDNLAPAPPGDLRMTSPVALAWDESEDRDFKYFTVYGSDVPGLDSTAALIGYTIGTSMDVTGDVYTYYHVTASDVSGNEGGASTAANAYAGVNTDESIPAAFSLGQNRPNPFSLKTSVAFDLPVGCAVSLKVFDAQGRQVRTLADQIYPAGRQSVIWSGDDEAGNAVGSGIYFMRMEAGAFRATSKMLLTR